MTKTVKVAYRCQKHEFSMTSIGKKCYYEEEVKFGFCKGVEPRKNSNSGVQNCRKLGSLPTFNRDGNSASPSFILPYEKEYYLVQKANILRDHELKMDLYCQQKSQICVAKPKPKNNFCSVCRCHYSDYLDHISTTKHKKKLNLSKFNRYIFEMSKKYEKKRNNGQILSLEQSDNDNQVKEVRLTTIPIKNQTNNQELSQPPPSQQNKNSSSQFYPFLQMPPTKNIFHSQLNYNYSKYMSGSYLPNTYYPLVPNQYYPPLPQIVQKECIVIDDINDP